MVWLSKATNFSPTSGRGGLAGNPGIYDSVKQNKKATEPMEDHAPRCPKAKKRVLGKMEANRVVDYLGALGSW
jgi:hypothetical protein